VIIGGAEDKLRDRVILQRFVALCGGVGCRIASPSPCLTAKPLKAAR
jgi:hypothetical protein